MDLCKSKVFIISSFVIVKSPFFNLQVHYNTRSLKSQLIFTNFLLKCQERKEVEGWTRTNIITYSVFSTIEVLPHIFGTPPRTWTLTNSFGDYRATNYTRGVWSRILLVIYTHIIRPLCVYSILCFVSLNKLSQYCLFLLCYNRHCKWLEFKNDLCIFLKNRSNWWG